MTYGFDSQLNDLGCPRGVGVAVELLVATAELGLVACRERKRYLIGLIWAAYYLI